MNFLYLILGVSTLIALYSFAKIKKVKPLYWAMIVPWVLFVLVIVIFIGTALGESEPRAALVGGSVLLVGAAVSGAGIWRVIK